MSVLICTQKVLTMKVFLKEFFAKNKFEKNQRMTKARKIIQYEK